MQYMDAAVPSEREQELAKRLRQSLQGCTQHIHGPVAAFVEIRSLAKSEGLRIAVIADLIQAATIQRQQQLVADGVPTEDVRFRKEATVGEFSLSLLRGVQQ